MKIIQAKREHIGAIFQLIQSESPFLLPRSKQEIYRNIKNFVVAVEKRRVVGCGAFEPYSKKISEIRSLVVLPLYRYGGIGRKIVDRLLQRARVGQEIFVVTSKLAYFKSLGFTPCLEERYILFCKKL